MKEKNNIICGHCGGFMNIQEFTSGSIIECPNCDGSFQDKNRRSFYHCPVCFSPFLLIYNGFSYPTFLCSNSECATYEKMDNSNLGSGNLCVSSRIYEQYLALIIQESFSIVILNGGDNGVVYSTPIKALAKSLFKRFK